MTVLSTDEVYEQYTGNGVRRFFEYGFTLTPETDVRVLVDGVPVSYTAQATGVLLDVAPPIGSVIYVYRITDITQLRDFEAFEEFHGDKTEFMMDKLILLKQEAIVYRAKCNLYASQPVEKVEIVNDKGSNADVYLWNEGFSGMFSGEVTPAMPAAGSIVEKPEDFAYFQYGTGGGGTEPYTNEYFVLIDDNNDILRYFGVDFDAQTWTQFGAFPATELNVVSDGTFCFISTNSNYNIKQVSWRGNCFTNEFTDAHEGSNPGGSSVLIRDYPYVIKVGTEDFSNGLRAVEYRSVAPFIYPTQYFRNPVGASWNGCWDIRLDNKGTFEYGDALVVTPENGNKLSTYQRSSGFLEEVSALTSTVDPTGSTTAWTVNRENGYIINSYAGNTFLKLYEADANLSVTLIGQCDTTDNVQAAIATSNGYILTAEWSSGPTGTVRTYSRVGTILTPVDSFTLTDEVTGQAQFFMSPRTDRFWLTTVSTQNGLYAFSVDDDGMIIEDIQIPGFATYNAGGLGNRMYFCEGPMNVTPNGFSGIKSKLYECWEMNESGSVTRIGAMGNYNLPILAGTVDSRAGTIGNAAYFNGSGALGTGSAPSYELKTVGTFSTCLDVVVDVLPGPDGDQYFYTRGNDVGDADYEIGCYVTGTGILGFFVGVNDTYYSAETVSTIVAGVKYHIYTEYNREDDTVSIRIDDGAIITESVTGNIDLKSSNRFIVGRKTASAGVQKYLEGSIDQFYWFWDSLTTEEQDWMYNSGNSRAFSEL